MGRRPFLRRTALTVGAGLAGTTLVGTAAAKGVIITTTINLDSNGVIPVLVEENSPELLPIGNNVVAGPRFGPSRLFQCEDEEDEEMIIQQESNAGQPRLFQCDHEEEETGERSIQQETDATLCAIRQAAERGIGTTPAHGGGHRRGRTSAVLHFRTQEADFEPTDVENGHVEAMLTWAVEVNCQTQAFALTDSARVVMPDD